MKRAILTALCVAASACSAAPAPEAPSPASSDTIEIEASAATRAETGVVVWSMSTSQAGGLTGLDAKDHVVVELGHLAKVEAGRELQAFILKDAGGESRVVFTVHPDGAIELLDAMVPEKHRRIGELIAADLNSQPRPSDAPSLATSSIGALADLVNEKCLQLVVQCDTWITIVNAARAEATKWCPGNDAVRAICKSDPRPDTCFKSYGEACGDAIRKNNEYIHRYNSCTLEQGSTAASAAEYRRCKEALANP